MLNRARIQEGIIMEKLCRNCKHITNIKVHNDWGQVFGICLINKTSVGEYLLNTVHCKDYNSSKEKENEWKKIKKERNKKYGGVRQIAKTN